LVHGTWARGYNPVWEFASWTHPAGKFVESLRAELELKRPDIDFTINAFAWTGGNSIFDRSDAADDLVKIVDAPNADFDFIIGHSHGGNVGLLAVTRSAAPRRLYLISIATPFLKVSLSARSQIDKKNLQNVLAILFLIGGAIIGWRLDPAITEFHFLGIAFGGAFGLFVSHILIKMLVNPEITTRDPTKFERRPETLAAAAYYDASALRNRLLVVRGVDDEASLMLAAAAIANRLAWILHRFGIRMLIGMSFALVIFGKFGFKANVDLVIWFGSFMLVLAAAALIPPFVRALFGKELAVGAGRCIVSAESAPDGVGGHVVTLPNDRGMVHSLYSNEECPRIVAAWISHKIVARSAYIS
jgi:hypothetical protein